MQAQRDHAHDVAVASQAAVDTMQALLARLDLPEARRFEIFGFGLSDPVPLEK